MLKERERERKRKEFDARKKNVTMMMVVMKKMKKFEGNCDKQGMIAFSHSLFLF